MQPLCEATTKGRYPFDRLSALDADMAAFATLFAPQGALDAFFAAHLAPLVDQSTSPWSIRQGAGGEGHLSAVTLDMFQRAAEIRGAFFADGARIVVRMEVLPEAMDTQATSVALGIDGNLVTQRLDDYKSSPTPIIWPGKTGEAFVMFTGAKEPATLEQRFEGAWAWPRLIDASKLHLTDDPNRNRLIVEVAGLIAIFDLRTTAPFPFGLSALNGFTCPTTLQ